MPFSPSRTTTASTFSSSAPWIPIILTGHQIPSLSIPVSSFSYSYPSPLLISPSKNLTNLISQLRYLLKQPHPSSISTLHPAYASSPPPPPPSNPLLYASLLNQPTKQHPKSQCLLVVHRWGAEIMHMQINLLRTTAHEPSHDKPPPVAPFTSHNTISTYNSALSSTRATRNAREMVVESSIHSIFNQTQSYVRFSFPMTSA